MCSSRPSSFFFQRQFLATATWGMANSLCLEQRKGNVLSRFEITSLTHSLFPLCCMQTAKSPWNKTVAPCMQEEEGAHEKEFIPSPLLLRLPRPGLFSTPLFATRTSASLFFPRGNPPFVSQIQVCCVALRWSQISKKIKKNCCGKRRWGKRDFFVLFPHFLTN